MIRIGYVGVNTILPTASRTFRLASYSEDKTLEYASANLKALQEILIWNLEHKIFLFRITSHLIPFGSALFNSGMWKQHFENEFQSLGRFIKENGMRVSMHPGQYTVLNTRDECFYQNSLNDLEYHNSILELMGLGNQHKIILHGGAAYGEKEFYIDLLLSRIKELPDAIFNRLTLENDERIFNAEDILKICEKAKLPAVFDVFHHQIFPSFENKSYREIIGQFKNTWGEQRQKIHYSNQEPGKHKGAHSETIDIDEFAKFYEEIAELDLDIMLEVKDKQDSVLKLRERFPELC